MTVLQAPTNTPWRESAEVIAQGYRTHLVSGLGREDAAHYLARYGHNRLIETHVRSSAKMLLAQFSDFMIIVLLIAAVVSGVVGEAVDAIAIVVIIVLNAAMGFVQEYRAERALLALKALAAPNAKVRRDGQLQVIPSDEVVPGDLIVIEAGDFVPADLRVVETADLRIDESALTGESVSVSKHSDAIDEPQLIVAERKNMLFRGTLATHGRGLGIAVATGMETEVGRIAALLDVETEQKTPLQKRLADFGRRLAIAVLILCGVLLALGVLRGEPPLLMFLTAISLAVAAIPEALPAVVTIVLGLGARQMVKQHALIRHLPAVETLGSVTVICSDKTGTLTQNAMHVEHLFCGGTGLETLLPAESARGPWRLLAQAMSVSNDVEPNEQGMAQGDPTETALFDAARHSGFDKALVARELPRVMELPFDADRKRMSTLHQQQSGFIAFTKGAPERVIPVCKYQLGVDGVESLDAQTQLNDAEALAAQGYRVLAFAYRNWTALPKGQRLETIESELVFLGLVAMMDPPRAEARAAVEQCQTAGIRPVMITGDHPATALAIARRLGIAGPQAMVMTGAGLAQLTAKQLARTVANYAVFARVSPEQKIAIVNALQSQGEFVAMTGDGVNDAPALKRADIGVAMGKQGTDVAREAADMVLLDDNFATIVAAVGEGRRIYDNIRKFIRYAMTGNSGEMWTLLLAPLMGLPIPLLPIHILWVNLISDGLPGLALAAEKAERDIMQRPPRPPRESVFSHGMWQHILWIGLLIGFISLFAQAWALNTGRHAQTIVFTVLALSQLVHVLAIRSERNSLFAIGVFSNPQIIAAIALTVVLQMMVIYVPALNEIFKTEPLDFDELMVCFTLPWLVLLAVELEKFLARRGIIYRDRAK